MRSNMNEFENLKTGYIDTIHYGMCQTGYNETMHGNEVLHKFCSMLVDNSSYSDSEKREMKYELDQIKEIISQEIEGFFSSRS